MSLLSRRLYWILVSLLLMAICATAVTAEGLPEGNSNHDSPADRSTYDGHLRVYIVEPVSRWLDKWYMPYHFGFLDYAVDSAISITGSETIDITYEWYSPDHGFASFGSDNIMAVAAVFNSEGHPAYAYPQGPANPFTAHYVDAAAGAFPGIPGSNESNEDFTHTVFLEEATATWCVQCPYFSLALDTIYESGEYPFYYVALVRDQSSSFQDSLAKDRLVGDLNVLALPTTYTDGGYQVLCGGTTPGGDLRAQIEAAGAREVPELLLDLSITCLGDNTLSVHVTVQLPFSNEAPLAPEAPYGQTVVSSKQNYTFTTSADDPNGDPVHLMWDFGDEITGWVGPYDSGAEAAMGHTWPDSGVYQVKVKAKDSGDLEGDWSPVQEVHVKECGDANSSTAVDIDDLMFMIDYTFTGGPLADPVELANVDCVGTPDIDDIMYLIHFIFTGGPSPCASCL